MKPDLPARPEISPEALAAVVWDPSAAVQITPHLCDRWRQRVDQSASNDQIAEVVLGCLRSLPRGGGIVKPGLDGEPALYVPINPFPPKKSAWQLKLSPALGDGWVVHTVTRHHSPALNQAERERGQRRAWDQWVAWCRERGESPIDNEPGLERLRLELDGKLTNRSRGIPRAARRATAEALGLDPDEYLSAIPRSPITTATGVVTRW